MLSTIATPCAGYRAGILNIDGDEKSNNGDPRDSKSGSSGGESDHWVSGEDGDGELVSDGIVDDSHGNPKLKKLFHETGSEPISV